MSNENKQKAISTLTEIVAQFTAMISTGCLTTSWIN